jgi:hypothetical protein
MAMASSFGIGSDSLKTPDQRFNVGHRQNDLYFRSYLKHGIPSVVSLVSGFEREIADRPADDSD